MSVDDYIKGKETRPCPISSDATGNMVVRGLYKNPVVAWREAVSNALWGVMESLKTGGQALKTTTSAVKPEW